MSLPRKHWRHFRLRGTPRLERLVSPFFSVSKVMHSQLPMKRRRSLEYRERGAGVGGRGDDVGRKRVCPVRVSECVSESERERERE